MSDLQNVFASWQRSAALHELRTGASEAEIQEFERAVGWELPAEWRRLYSFTNGASLLEGNLACYPLMGADISLEKASASHRAAEWPVPDELWIAGDNGQGEPFGLWLPAATREAAPIVAVGQTFKPECLAVVGSSLEAFLLSRTAYYLLLYGAPPEALDAIGLPEELRAEDPDEETWIAIGRWADPARPGTSDDPYEAELDAPAVRALLGGSRP
jgi:hypothetical protein